MTKATKVEENQTVDAKHEALNSFVDAVINKNDEAMASSISSYIVAKSRDILGTKAPAVAEDAPPVEKDVADEDDEDEVDDSKYLANRDKKKAPLKKMKKMEEAKVVEDAEATAKVEADEDEEEEDADEKTAKFLSNRDKKKAPLKKMKKMEEEVENPFKLKGNDILLKEKPIGSIVNDTSNANAKIVFTPTEGQAKEFPTMEELYQHLVDKFNVGGEGTTASEE